MQKYFYQCIKDGKKSNNFDHIECEHGPRDNYYDYLDVIYDYDKIKEFPLKDQIGVFRFLPLLPLKKIKVSLGEGQTPIVKIDNYCKHIGLGGYNIYVKNEALNPTGCFKDLESLVVINKALEDKKKNLLVVSSGNAASSAAAYATKAGLNCLCVILKKTHQIKKDTLRTAGGKVKEFSGFYEDAYRFFSDHPLKGYWNITSGKNPLRVEGDKIIAFELWEELGVPDKIVVPAGNGSLLCGIWKGFVELKKIGKIKKIPQMIGVQVKGAAPLKKALELGKDYVILKNIKDSIAEGIVAEESYCSPKAVKAVKESNGEVIVVNDKEIKQALAEIITTESLQPEPTSAAVYAALPKIKIKPKEKVVCIQTGSGERNLSNLLDVLQNKN
ncbi:MAG: pyridoxal-phosphate dependent enzyme [Candidatus Buchananbacteria bacterium]